jgi:hypothetical protein
MSPLLSREKFHRLTHIFMAKNILINYNLCSKIFGNLSFVELYDMTLPAVTRYPCSGYFLCLPLIAIVLAAWGPCPPTSFDPTHPTFLSTPPGLPYSIIDALLIIPIIIHSRSSAPSISRRSINRARVGWKSSSWMLVNSIPWKRMKRSDALASGTERRAWAACDQMERIDSRDVRNG